MEYLVALDYQWFQVINGWANHYRILDAAMVFFTKLGIPLMLLYLASLVVRGDNAEKRLRNRTTVMVALCAAVLALAINGILAQLLFRDRPFIDHAVNLLVYHDATSSWPSNHAAISAAMAMSLCFRRRWGARVCTTIAVLVALSRVYVGVHYPMDIISGFIIGIVASFIIISISEKLEHLLIRLQSHYEKQGS